MVKCWMGVDVHQKYFQICVLDAHGVAKYLKVPSDDRGCIDTEIKNAKPEVMAIDCPRGPSKNNVLKNRRVSEYVLGIGGYYATKSKKQACAKWMQTGFKLYKRLEKKAIEVFPGYAFYWRNDFVWPPKKKTRKGMQARIRILRNLVKNLQPGKTNDHEIDSLMAAVLAKIYGKRQGAGFLVGDRDEGPIFMPRPVTEEKLTTLLKRRAKGLKPPCKAFPKRYFKAR